MVACLEDAADDQIHEHAEEQRASRHTRYEAVRDRYSEANRMVSACGDLLEFDAAWFPVVAARFVSRRRAAAIPAELLIPRSQVRAVPGPSPAARSFDTPVRFSGSYCFSCSTLARLPVVTSCAAVPPRTTIPHCPNLSP